MPSCSSPRSLRRPPLLACLLLLAPLLACSEAETPDAQFDGGVVHEFFDAGPGFGGRDEPCANGRCSTNALVCVNETQSNGTSQNICRALCDLDDDTDPCGLGFTCGRLENDQGFCRPAGGLDGECPCDEGYSCVRLTTNTGEINTCKRTCVVEENGNPLDAGPWAVEDCPAQQTCVRLSGDNSGVCLDD